MVMLFGMAGHPKPWPCHPRWHSFQECILKHPQTSHTVCRALVDPHPIAQFLEGNFQQTEQPQAFEGSEGHLRDYFQTCSLL